MSDDSVAKLAKFLVVIVTAVALNSAIHSSQTLVNLLLLGYDGVTQFFPGVVLGLYWRRVTKTAVWIGMVAGVLIVAVLVLSKNDPVFGINAGFFALCLNFLIVASVSMLTPVEGGGFNDTIESAAGM
jgi:solute:Na+ symporter, SSS family